MKPKLMIVGMVLVMLAAAIAVTAAGAGDPGPAGDKAQDARDRTLRDSKALLRSGNYDAAIQRLESLYASFPDDPMVASSLSGALLEAKRYDRAEAVLKASVAKRPKDPKGLGDLASLCFMTGRKNDGLAYLEKMIALAPEEDWAYQGAFLILLANGAPDDAVSMVARARRATGDSALLARDVADIYKGLARYDAATAEYVLAGQSEHDPEMAIDGIMEMAERPDARAAIVAKLNEVATSRDVEDMARGALWQIYLMDGDCERAFGEISALARLGKLATETVRHFAAKSTEKGCNRQCAEVYGLALGLPENKADIPRLMLSKAECELAAGLSDQAIATYGSLVRQYSDSKWAFGAEVALGRIYSSQGNLDQAIAQADRVISAGSAGDVRYDAILFKGGCLVEAGRLDEAFQTYDLVETGWDKAYAQEAFYELGEIKFYQGDFDGAVSYYNVTLREYPDEPRANDAVGRLLVIKSVKGDLGTMWLKEFAQGVLLERQGRVDEAQGIFARRAGEQGQGLVKIESLKGLATIAAGRGDLAGAIKLYRLVGDTLDNYYSPSALEAVGDIYASQGKAPEAIQAYEQVILKYPQSVSAGEARRKIDVAKRESQGAPTGEAGATK
jgi:tetratricopeptide (TPR) repeat protein